MAIIRGEVDFSAHFAQVPNEWARDANLSHRARGVLLVLMSHRSGWEVTTEHLIRNGTEGRDAIRKAIRELVDQGYLQREQVRGEDSARASGSRYVLTGKPLSDGFSGAQKSDMGGSGFSGAQKSPPKNTKINNTKNKNVQPPSGGSRNPDPPGFDDWWKHYPRKEAKGDARKAFKAALRKTDLATLIATTKRYATEVRGTERKFQKLPGGWLRDERWLDYGHQPADVTDEQVVELLGPDNWQPDTSGMSFETVDEEMKYRRRVLAERHEARRDEARRMLEAAGS